jgi:hypothetical protein
VNGEEVDSASPEQQPAGADDLIRAASAWAQDALAAIHDDTDHRAAVAGPMAVELLGKAALWRTNPLLVLAPDVVKDSVSVVKIASGPDLRAPRMRTIYLGDVLKKVAILLSGLPLDQAQQDRLCDVRNGGAHAGLPGPSRQVTEDSLSVLDVLIAHLDLDPDAFYGNLSGTAATLRASYRDAIDARVQLEVVGAWVGLQALKKSLGEGDFEVLCDRRYTATDDDLDPEEFGSGFYRTARECPACSAEGRLFGRVEIDDRVDFDHEKIGPGEYESIPHVYWVPSLIPDAFACNVCKLILRSAAELAAAGLPDSGFEVSEDALGPDFDLTEAASAASGWRD